MLKKLNRVGGSIRGNGKCKIGKCKRRNEKGINVKM